MADKKTTLPSDQSVSTDAQLTSSDTKNIAPEVTAGVKVDKLVSEEELISSTDEQESATKQKQATNEPAKEPTMQQKEQPNNPLHGVKLADVLEYLTENYTWEGLGMRIEIRCFTHDPSIKSSLKFLRKHQWARDKVEQLYLDSKAEDKRLGL